MSRKIIYTAGPIRKVRVVRDFLPPPAELAPRDEGVKVTIALSRRSVDFFKREARRHNTQYQRMIRRLLDTYTEQHERPLTTRSAIRDRA
jgi:predicted DNA binding CopG/RHH family protein